MKHRMDEDQDGDFVTECPVCEEFVIASPRGAVLTKRCPHLVSVEREGDERFATFRPGGRID